MSVDGNFRAKRVLVIDDSPDIRVLIRQHLEQEGYETLEMDSADNLECTIHDIAPDLVLCDLLMPGRDGMAVCKMLRANPETRAIPVILISAKNFEVDKRAALAAGASSYLVKPFTGEALIKSIGDVLSTQSSVSIWGCRGSIAAPEMAYGIYGGNTTCIDVVVPGNRHIIFDAGTGIRALGNSIMDESPMRLALFLTHFHWDHVQGLPFFKPLYVPGNEIHIFGPADSNDHLVSTIEGQMGGAFFPISTDSFRSSVKFFGIQEESFEIFDVQVSTLYVLHPGRTLAYRIRIGDRCIVFVPDNELLPECVEPELTGEALRLAEFAAGASLLIHDCQFSRKVYESRRGWGHSCGEAVAAVAAAAQPERVLLFHHDPDNTDEQVEAIHREFQRHLDRRGGRSLSDPAREGLTYLV